MRTTERKIIYRWILHEQEKWVFSKAYPRLLWMCRMEEDDSYMQKSVCNAYWSVQVGLQFHEMCLDYNILREISIPHEGMGCVYIWFDHRKEGKGPQGIICSFSYRSSVRIFPSVVISDRLSWVDLCGAISCEEMGWYQPPAWNFLWHAITIG